MRRYVILTHDHPFLHWDLMVECGDVLRTWRLTTPPSANDDVPAEPIEDHRLHYLNYEGPVSGNRGFVTRWDAGLVESMQEDSGEVRVELTGEKLGGELRLQRRATGEWICRYWPRGPG